MLWLVLLLLAVSGAAAAEGSLRVKADVAEVRVFLDGNEVGKTPVTLHGVAAGPHRVTLVKDAFETQERTVQVVSGETIKIFVVMSRSATAPLPLPATFRVAHQHTSGHCLGNLVITPAGMEYKGDNGKDAFQIPVSAIRGVTRSTGERWERIRVERLGDEERKPLACRIETSERAYGFWAYDGDAGSGDVDPRQEQQAMQWKVGPKTRELFNLIYELWNASRSAEPAIHQVH